MMSSCSPSTLSLLFFLVLGCSFPAEAALTKQHSRLHQGAGLRGAPSNADESTKEDTADDDDDDDDDDDADTAAAPAPAKPAAKKAAKKEDKATKPITRGKVRMTSPHAAEEARMTKAVLTAKRELAENRREQSEITLRVKHLSDPQRSDREIDSTAKLVANETESPAMGDMLGRMWKEMRMFEVPLYAEGAQEELAHLKRHEKESEAKLESAQKRLSVAEKKWAKESKKGKRGTKKDDEDEDEDDEEEKSEGADGDAEKDAEEPKKSQEMKVEAPPIKRIDTPGKVPINTWNFWAMEHKRKMATLLTSFIYLVSGIILAFVYKKLRDLYPESFTPVQKGGVYSSPKDFSHGILACFGDIKICVAGCFCPGMRWADTLDSTKDGITQRKHMPYWKAFAAFFICVLLHIYTWGISSIALVIMGVVYRQKLRQTYKIENRTPKTWALDFLAWSCCLPCAIIQEARESSAQRV